MKKKNKTKKKKVIKTFIQSFCSLERVNVLQDFCSNSLVRCVVGCASTTFKVNV